MSNVIESGRRPAPAAGHVNRAGRAGRASRAVCIAAVTVMGLATLGACRSGPQPPPTGGGAGRYRSELFTRIDKETVEYAPARDIDDHNRGLVLDLRRPAGDQVTGRPLFVLAYGGAFITGSKDNRADAAYQLAEIFARKGYVTAMINYRLLANGFCTSNSPGSQCKAAAEAGIEDGVAAVRYLRANADRYGIDPNRIAIGGSSAGGVIAAGAGVLGEEQPRTNRATPGVSGRVQAFMAHSGGLPAEDTRGRFDAQDAPGILFTGTADFIVSPDYSRNVVRGLTGVGVDAKLVEFPGAGHVPWGAQQRTRIVNETTEFFYRHLDLANAPT